MVSCYIKIVAYQSEIRFDPSIPDLGDLEIPHAIVSVKKLIRYTIHYNIFRGISITKYGYEFVVTTI
jgi:hypothetical protein